jgi:hypothetical protein
MGMDLSTGKDLEYGPTADSNESAALSSPKNNQREREKY